MGYTWSKNFASNNFSTCKFMAFMKKKSQVENLSANKEKRQVITIRRKY